MNNNTAIEPKAQPHGTACASCEQPINRPFRVVFAPTGRLANGQIEVGAFFIHCGCAERIEVEAARTRKWKGRAA